MATLIAGDIDVAWCVRVYLVCRWFRRETCLWVSALVLVLVWLLWLACEDGRGVGI